ncbi:MAG: hypothetical protein GY711_08860 [bacterium]|nr:hypothetical protein [bacterium]
MKEHPMNDQEGKDESAERDADLLESILNGEPMRDDARVEARRLELEAFLATCRETFAGDEEVDRIGARRLAGRILARTTREDLSWRGDIGLMVRYVKSRFADSAALRVAAAVLLVHFVVAPSVLAYYVFVKPEPDLWIKYEQRGELPYALEVEEPPLEIEFRPLDDDDEPR